MSVGLPKPSSSETERRGPAGLERTGGGVSSTVGKSLYPDLVLELLAVELLDDCVIYTGTRVSQINIVLRIA